MLFTVTDIIDILTLFQLIMLAVVLVITNRGRRISNHILALYFLIQSNCVMYGFIWRYYDWTYAHCPHLFYLHLSPLTLLGPGLYLFTVSMTTPGFKFKKMNLLYLLPFVVHFGFFFFKFHHFDAETKRSLISQNAVLTPLESRIVDNVFFLLLMIFSILIIHRLIVYRRRIKDYYSSTIRTGLNWLIFVDTAFILLWMTDIIDYYYFWWLGKHSFIIHIGHPMVFILATIMVFKALVHPEQFLYKESGEKYALTKSQIKNYCEILIKIMEEKKPYLAPELSLNDLSKMTGIQPRYLSRIINEKLNQNFYDFINRYRIQASQKYMKDSEKSDWTILEILYDVGFNSKASFNTAFKKYTGMTPTRYRRSFKPFIRSGCS